MLTATEIRPGLVLHLDPRVLDAEGAACSCAPGLRVKGPHFFVCISASGALGQWLPLYSRPGVGRRELPPHGRTGHEKWADGTFFWHKDQVWTASADAIQIAAKAGGDKSTPTARNLIAPTALPRLT